jgi:hypothetical protein
LSFGTQSLADEESFVSRGRVSLFLPLQVNPDEGFRLGREILRSLGFQATCYEIFFFRHHAAASRSLRMTGKAKNPTGLFITIYVEVEIFIINFFVSAVGTNFFDGVI